MMEHNQARSNKGDAVHHRESKNFTEELTEILKRPFYAGLEVGRLPHGTSDEGYSPDAEVADILDLLRTHRPEKLHWNRAYQDGYNDALDAVDQAYGLEVDDV